MPQGAREGVPGGTGRETDSDRREDAPRIRPEGQGQEGGLHNERVRHGESPYGRSGGSEGEGDQPSLHEAVIDAFLYGKVSDTSTEMECDHGRIEERTCRIAGAENIEDGEVRGRWPGLRTIVEVTSRVTSGESVTTSVRHYISDEDYPKAAYYAMLARGHWGIENQLHWHLDVTFHEDACRARKGFASQNLSTVRKLALQILKAHNDKKSIRKRIFSAALSQHYLFDVLLNAKI